MKRLLKRYLSKRRVLLVILDVLMLSAAVVFAAVVWLGDPQYVVEYHKQIILVIGIQVLCMYINNLYDIHRDYAGHRLFWSIAISIGAALAVSLVLFFAGPPLKIPSRPIFFLSGMCAVGCAYAGRVVYGKLFLRRFRRRLLVIGMGALTGKFLELCRAGKCGIYEIAGIVTVGEGATSFSPGIDAGVWGESKDIGRIVADSGIDIIAVGVRKMPQDMVRSLIPCMQAGCEIVSLEDLYENLSGCVPYYVLDEEWFLYAHIGQRGLYLRFFKPLIERSIAFVLLVLLLPVVILIALLTKVSDGGSVFFRQERVGFLGRKFNMVKFRTMRPDAEKHSGPVWASPDDPRVTPLGKILRKARLDEIPQLWNVLCGEMAFVGPRPEREHFVEKFKEMIPFYGYRLTVLPGITGWAQIRCPYDTSIESVREKLAYDFYYIKHCSPPFDVAIMLRTIRVLLTGEGSR
jgi:exopolysaccharide biosynthesis polyprenyl glycosylphosphotransferase